MISRDRPGVGGGGKCTLVIISKFEGQPRCDLIYIIQYKYI